MTGERSNVYVASFHTVEPDIVIVEPSSEAEAPTSPADAFAAAAITFEPGIVAGLSIAVELADRTNIPPKTG